MRYLKVFERFDTDDYYTVQDVSYDIVLEKFSPKELSIIKDKLSGLFINEVSAYGILAKKFYNIKSLPNKCVTVRIILTIIAAFVFFLINNFDIL
mgnify:CR=1 FL=1